MKKHTPTRPPGLFSRSTLLRPLLLTFLLAGSPPGFAADISTRIIGGFPSAEGDWPWMTHVRAEVAPGSFFECGGTLIRPSWVMTAAHCVFDPQGNLMPPEWFDVLVGEIDLLAGERIPVVRIIPYPDYQPPVDYNDIALLQLKRPAPQQPVQLPGLTFVEKWHNPAVPPGTMATALGWGTTSTESDVFPRFLQQVDLPIVDEETCQQAYAFDIKETQVCAGFVDGGKDACQGDSGGPLVAQSPPTGPSYVQVGITSFGEGCAQPNAYGVYTRVSSYSLWVTQNTCSPAERPAAPFIKLSLRGTDAQLDFAPVAGATGYRLYWAPYPEMYPVFQRDIGTSTSVNATLPSGIELWVAVDAYNGNCLGPFSNIEPLLVP